MPDSSLKLRRGSGRPNLGVSACLLGRDVRYNGGNCTNPFVTRELSRFFNWVPVCPEVEMGMSVPREPLRLTGSAETVSMVGLKTGTDYTETMHRFAAAKMGALAPLGLHGFILKNKSPSCGMERIPVFGEQGLPVARTSGLFVQALNSSFPLLPTVEEGRLNDIRQRENFLEAVYAYQRWQLLLATSPEPKDLVAFHTDHEYQLLGRNEKTYRELGRLVAHAAIQPFDGLLTHYGEGFMACFQRPANPKTVANLLFHLMGFLNNSIDRKDKRELADAIASYQNGQVPLIAPLGLLHHHFRKNPHSRVARQSFLEPYPLGFNMRSHL